MKNKESITLQNMVEWLKPLLKFPNCNLLDSIPASSRAAANFIDKYGDELEQQLGRRPIIIRARYTPSGSGQFGRLSSKRATNRKTIAKWK